MPAVSATQGTRVIAQCPACGGEPGDTRRYQTDPGATAAAFSGIVAHGIFSGVVHVCGACGHGWMAVMPSDADLGAYYREAYWSGRGDPASLGEAPHYRYRARAQVSFIEPYLPTVREIDLLEIGAGSAAASRLTREILGERVHLHVCEPSEIWQPFYQAHGIRHVAEMFPFGTGFLADHIHASHWLEHVADLPATITELGCSCRRGGTVFIEVPNTGHDYWELGIPGIPHLHFFTAMSLRRSFVEHGFDCRSLAEFGPTMRAWWEGYRPGERDYEAKDRGMWLRAIFQRK